ncbi:hypothetical protein SBA1_270048 [Candidatus Sulfotelmatobacter kueseliae]|uniref:Uncharacterized protein n=1 Tax=Candidatus Sulfotelmatobacter kueseliae TaxID=2042962 RepID=A0A2U3KI77_9BACT|nr:hypothetical protein SBA1_270048 [Candidatus Sulfotelmatobacter kueseliae]
MKRWPATWETRIWRKCFLVTTISRGNFCGSWGEGVPLGKFWVVIPSAVVPKGPLTVARRFNAGERQVVVAARPGGTPETFANRHHGSAVPPARN